MWRQKLKKSFLIGKEVEMYEDQNIEKISISAEDIKVEINQLNSDPFLLTDYAKLIFNNNELPKDVEQNDAYYRRLLIVPFVVTIPVEERDSTLPNRIIESELAGVFNIKWVDFGQPYFETDLFKAYLKLSSDLKPINPNEN